MMAIFSKVDVLSLNKMAALTVDYLHFRSSLPSKNTPSRQRRENWPCSPGVIVGNLFELIVPVGSPIESFLL
jgi:hypothetical protein